MLSLDVTKKCLVAEGWSPVFATNKVPLQLEALYILYSNTNDYNFDREWLALICVFRSKMHCTGLQLTVTHKLVQFSKFFKQKRHRLPISRQTSSPVLFKKS